jgi:hypothetical protein
MANPLPEEQNFAAKLMVMNTLGSSHVANLNFNFAGYTINREFFHPVFWGVFLGDIGVYYCPWLTGHAEYYSGNENSMPKWRLNDWRVKNSFHLGFCAPTDPRHESLIIHEAVHASLDKRRAKINLMTNEALAYVTQAMYFMRSRQSSLGGDILGAATNIAKQIARGVAVDPLYVEQLRDEINSNPNYSGKDMMNWQAVCNGV